MGCQNLHYSGGICLFPVEGARVNSSEVLYLEGGGSGFLWNSDKWYHGTWCHITENSIFTVTTMILSNLMG
jgi:hypothetical protein